MQYTIDVENEAQVAHKQELPPHTRNLLVHHVEENVGPFLGRQRVILRRHTAQKHFNSGQSGVYLLRAPQETPEQGRIHVGF